VRFLGSYPRAGNGAPGTPASAVALGTTDASVFAAAQQWLDDVRAGTVA
jgi:hypothetical protein